MQNRTKIGRLAADGDGLTKQPGLLARRPKRADRGVDLARVPAQIDSDRDGNGGPAGDLG